MLICLDIVSFTENSLRLSSAHICKMLQNFYERVDNSSVCHNVDKIDIIGDAFVGVSQSTNDAVGFCLAALAIAKTTYWDNNNPSLGVLHLRCAVHAGKVTGLVLDAVPFKYTLVGDAIIQAKTLETTTPPGNVHCSAAAAAYLDTQKFQKVSSSTSPDSYLIFPTTKMQNTIVIVKTLHFEQVSEDMASLFGFNFHAAELRSMRVLFGPKTRIEAIRMGMEQCLEFNHHTSIPVILYTRDAMITRVLLEFSKADDMTSCVLLQCVLLASVAAGDNENAALTAC